MDQCWYSTARQCRSIFLHLDKIMRSLILPVRKTNSRIFVQKTKIYVVEKSGKYRLIFSRLSGVPYSSVRRILKKGARNFRKFEMNKDQNENCFIQNQSDFLLKIRWRSKKGLHSNLVQFFALSLAQAKNKGLRLPFVCSKLLGKLQEGGACRNFAYYSMLIILSWWPKGGHGPTAPL